MYIFLECISGARSMQVSKWGRLAIRLPARLAEKLGLKEGNEVEVSRGFGGVL